MLEVRVAQTCTQALHITFAWWGVMADIGSDINARFADIMHAVTDIGAGSRVASCVACTGTARWHSSRYSRLRVRSHVSVGRLAMASVLALLPALVRVSAMASLLSLVLR